MASAKQPCLILDCGKAWDVAITANLGPFPSVSDAVEAAAQLEQEYPALVVDVIWRGGLGAPDPASIERQLRKARAYCGQILPLTSAEVRHGQC